MLFNVRRFCAFLFKYNYAVILTTCLITFFFFIFYSYLKLGYYLDVEHSHNIFKTIDSRSSKQESLASLLERNNELLNALSYCNYPYEIDVGSELLPTEIYKRSGLKLKSVVIAIRHGDRGPLRPLRGFNSINCQPVQYFPTSSETDAPKKVDKSYYELFTRYKRLSTLQSQKLVRFSNLYSSIPEDSCRLHHLTQIGSLQHLILGSKLAATYKRLLDIDPKTAKADVKAFTTMYPRTFQSALAFLFGFLSPKDDSDLKDFPSIEHAIGIHFCGQTSRYCAKCDKVVQISRELEKERATFIKSNPIAEDLMFKLRNIVSFNDTLFSSFESVYDALMAFMCHELPVPCNEVTDDCATVDEITKFISLMHSYYGQIISLPSYHRLNVLKMRGFYVQLIDHFRKIRRKESTSKLVLYSGHDLTIIPMSSVLNITEAKLPPYASRLIFEAYGSDDNDELYLRVIYNGKDVTKDANFCQSEENCIETYGSTLIPLKRFEKFINSIWKTIANDDSFENACKSS